VTKTISLPEDVDHVVHAAGLVGVAESWSRPADFIAVNAGGPANVLEYSRTHGCSVTVLSDSGQSVRVSGSAGTPSAANPYALSKYLAELVCHFFYERHATPITVLRVFNVYGPGQSRRFLIPTVLEQLLDPSSPVIEVDDLQPRRDYVYVTDVASAIATTLGRRGFSMFTVGYGVSYSVAEVIEMAMKVSGIRKDYRDRGLKRRSEVRDVTADISALREAGWTPVVDLEAGLATILGAMRSR